MLVDSSLILSFFFIEVGEECIILMLNVLLRVLTFVTCSSAMLFIYPRRDCNVLIKRRSSHAQGYLRVSKAGGKASSEGTFMYMYVPLQG